jgi:hypothetical protein
LEVGGGVGGSLQLSLMAGGLFKATFWPHTTFGMIGARLYILASPYLLDNSNTH